MADGGIGMLRSWSKLTVESAREKDTHHAVHMHDPPRTRAYLHPIHRTAPAGFKRLFSIRTDRKSDNSSPVVANQQALVKLLSNYYISHLRI